MNILIWMLREPLYVLVGLPIIILVLWAIGRSSAARDPKEGRS